MNHFIPLFRRWRELLFLGLAVSVMAPAAIGQQERLLGLDISAWQGNMSQTTWNNLRNVENRQFVVLRSSRGGTTGYYDQTDADNSNGNNTLSQRYDDPYYIQNVNRASAAGMFVGSYHFSRPDIVESTLNSGGIRNNGTDEADHFIQMAGPWMRPGYLVPVHDLEAGSGIRSSEEMAQFSLDFANRIYEKMGIRPAIYINGSYNNILAGASQELRDQLAKPAALQPSVVSPAYPTLWIARWPNQANPNSIDVQNGEPSDSISSVYGIWDDYGTTHPWTFWQYASTMRLQSFNNGNSNLDADVVRGGVEFLKDTLVPAVWMHDGDGLWTALTNWNSGQTPVQPVPGPGQVTPVATGPLPTPRLPGTNDTIILERPNANITVTLSSGTHNIRKLYVREALNVTGGSLTVNYVPSWDSTINGAQFSAPVSLNNATLNVHTLQVDANQTFTMGGGILKFSQISLMRGTQSATFLLNGNVTLDSWSNSVFSISGGAGTGNLGKIDLGGGTRTLSMMAGNDLTIGVPIQNGAVVKSGTGTLRLNAASSYSGGTVVSAGSLFVNNTSGSGTGSGTVTVNAGTLGGTGIISGVTTINSAGTLAPGTDTMLGTLTFGSSPVLNGTNFFRIDRNGGSPISDRIARSSGSLAFGGILRVANTGAALSGGEVFTLFSAASYSGFFATTNVPVLVTGLNWYFGKLGVDGTVHVNRRPSVTYVAVQSTPGQTLPIPISSLIASGSDADGDALSLASFDSITTNGVTLTSDGTNIYYFSNSSADDRFNYTLSDGRGGNTTSFVVIGQNVPAPPSIQSGPSNLTVVQGQNATFSVTVSGSAPFSYQWRFNGTNIGGATASAFTRVSAQPAHAGPYSVFISNAYGNVTSGNATLTVVTPPTIVTHPQSAVADLGQNVIFSVGAAGTAPLSYQWRKEGNPIAGATLSTLTLNNVTTNDVAAYSVVVGNPYGSVTSQDATLTLTPFELLWQLPPYSRPYLTSVDLPEQRGMTFNRVSERLLLVHRVATRVHVLDKNGADLWTLNTNGVTGGLNTSYHLLLIAAADDGAIYACNLKASSAPFKIYRWANDNSNTVPTVAFTGDPSPATGGRWGDTFDVRGSGTNTQILIGPRQGTNVVLFTTTDGINFTPNVINLTDVPSGHCGLNVTFGPGNTFWGTTHTNLLRLVAFDPTAGTASTVRVYSDAQVPMAVNPIGYSPSLNVLAGVHVNSPNHLRIYDLNPVSDIPALIGAKNFSTDNSNTHTGTGAVRFGGDVIYALGANNGLMAVRLRLPAGPLRFSGMTLGPQVTLQGTGPLGRYALETTSAALTNWSSAGTLAIGFDGTFNVTDSSTNSHRLYRLRKQ